MKRDSANGSSSSRLSSSSSATAPATAADRGECLEVLFVDYGNRGVVRADPRDVRPLVPEAARLPLQAVQFALAGVPFDTQLTSSEAVRSFLRTTLVHKLLLAHLHRYDVFHNRWQVFLYLVGDDSCIHCAHALHVNMYCTLVVSGSAQLISRI